MDASQELMQKSGPEKLNYIAPEEDEGEVPGVSRYYREPPALSRLVGIVVAILIGVAAIIAIGFLYLRRGF